MFIAEVGYNSIDDSFDCLNVSVRSADDKNGGKIFVLIYPATSNIFEMVFDNFRVKAADEAIAEVNELDLLACC